jgi:hypothetical protein
MRQVKTLPPNITPRRDRIKTAPMFRDAWERAKGDAGGVGMESLLRRESVQWDQHFASIRDRT